MTSLAALCASVDNEEVALNSVRRIRRMLPAYRVIPPDEHLNAVRVQQGNQLAALASERPVGSVALEATADLARDRARQGIDIEVLIGAYHLGDQVLWQALVEASDRTNRSVLPRAASLLFASLHAISASLTATHAEVTQALQSRRISAGQRLVELLLAGDAGEEAGVLADTLNLDPDGTYAVLLCRRERPGHLALSAGLLRRLDGDGIRFAAGRSGTDDLVVCEGATVADLVHRLGSALDTRGCWWTVGLTRTGLRGAVESLADARLAAGMIPAVARDDAGAVIAFADVWADACVLTQARRLEPLVQRPLEIAAKHPHLAAAVLAFADADMQIARAAQALHLHANSLSYRLDRWAELTGWSPRSFHDLRRSVLAIGSGGATPGIAAAMTPQRSRR